MIKPNKFIGKKMQPNNIIEVMPDNIFDKIVPDKDSYQKLNNIEIHQQMHHQHQLCRSV